MAGKRNRSIRLPVKARYGAPCSGCGMCCSNEVCEIGRAIFSVAESPCPGLIYADGRGWCKLVLMDDTKFIAFRLGIGAGCCSDDRDENTNMEETSDQ